MVSFAIVLSSRPTTLDGVLMILDQRGDADEIAFELISRGQDVDVVELPTPGPAAA